MPQYFIDKDLEIGDTGVITGDDCFHLLRVRRIKINDIINLRDISRQFISAIITGISSKRITFKVSNISKKSIMQYKLELALCLIKGKNFELAIRKAAEIGVSAITPIISERSVPEINNKINEKTGRWQKIIREASKQCLRADIPVLNTPQNFTEFVQANDYTLKLIAHTEKRKGLYALKEILSADVEKFKDIKVIVGPEGGFSENEISIALENNWQQINLGSNHYRAETAALVIPAIILYELENLFV